MEKSWRRRGDRADLVTIRCSTFRRSEKHLLSFLRKKKISAVTEERLSAGCSRLFPPCYSFSSYGREIKEKTIEEKVRSGKAKGGEINKVSQGGSCGGKRTPPPGGNPPQTRRTLPQYHTPTE